MKSLIGCLVLATAACRGGAQERPPTIADSAFMPIGIRAAELPDPTSRGARLVPEYCAQCHGIPSPASHAASEWDATLRRMVMHMERGEHMPGMRGMMSGGMGMGRMGMTRTSVPTDAELRTIREYLEAHSLRSVAPDSLPGAGTAGATIFAHTCSRCHALPNPAQHAPADWASVVARMRANMRRFRVDTISDETAREIIVFLERNASGK